MSLPHKLDSVVVAWRIKTISRRPEETHCTFIVNIVMCLSLIRLFILMSREEKKRETPLRQMMVSMNEPLGSGRIAVMFIKEKKALKKKFSCN